jgi:hypothetical protein
VAVRVSTTGVLSVFGFSPLGLSFSVPASNSPFGRRADSQTRRESESDRCDGWGRLSGRESVADRSRGASSRRMFAGTTIAGRGRSGTELPPFKAEPESVLSTRVAIIAHPVIPTIRTAQRKIYVRSCVVTGVEGGDKREKVDNNLRCGVQDRNDHPHAGQPLAHLDHSLGASPPPVFRLRQSSFYKYQLLLAVGREDLKYSSNGGWVR